MENVPQRDSQTGEDPPLPATLGFVFTVGTLFAIGWALMFLLLRTRW
jgi:hypothetical protein